MQNASAIEAARINVNNGNEMHYETIRNRLTHLAGDAPDSNAIAEATLSSWNDVADRLAPVIGGRGIDALFNRSLHVTCKTFPWLAIGEDEVNGAAQLAGLRVFVASPLVAPLFKLGWGAFISCSQRLAGSNLRQ